MDMTRCFSTNQATSRLSNSGVPCTEDRVVATATLGDIVKEPRQIEQFQLGDLTGNGSAKGGLAVSLGTREVTQMPQKPQGVLVHRIDVEEIVLHAPDDVGEGRQVGGQDPVAVHARQGGGGSLDVAHDLHEEATGPQVPADAVIDEVPAFADQADGAGADSLDLRMGLK
jgi:hypothetical protein